MIEDPSRQLNYLQQCLSNDKKPLGLFLGAGCPMAVRVDPGQIPLIPDIAGITKHVRDTLGKDKYCEPLLAILDGQFRTDGREAPSVEEMLTQIRALRAVAGKDSVRGLCSETLDKLDDALCQNIHNVVDKKLPSTETPYHHVAAWADAARRDNPIEVFTTNYDLLMEQAFEDTRVPYFDGFAGVQKPFFDLRAMEEDMLPPRWARLWKLHGSINWYQVTGKGVFRGTTREDGSSKRVIHPSHLKYEESRRLPYLAMMDRLRKFIERSTSTLILCGYSFRDEHINEVIMQGLQRTQTAVAFALMFKELVTYPDASRLSRRQPNLNVLARDKAIIGGQEVSWPENVEDTLDTKERVGATWKRVEPTNGNGRRSVEFTLGDFAVLGAFLQELVGSVRQRNGVPDAR